MVYLSFIVILLEIFHNGGLATCNCLQETNPKQTSGFFHCKTVPLGNYLIEPNQVVSKFPPCTTDDDRSVENALVLKLLENFSFSIINLFKYYGNKTMELMFVNINIFWARLRLI